MKPKPFRPSWWGILLGLLLPVTSFGAYQFNPITTNNPAGMSNVIFQASSWYGFLTNSVALASLVNQYAAAYGYLSNGHTAPVKFLTSLSVTNLGAGYALSVMGTNEAYVQHTESTTDDLFNRWKSRVAYVEWGIWSNALYFQNLAGTSNGMNFFVDNLAPDHVSVHFDKGINGITATNFMMMSPQWADVPMNYAFSVTGPSAPSLVDVSPTSPIKGIAFDNGDILYANAQYFHNLAVTNANFPEFYIMPHIHFSTIGAGLPDATHSNVTWQIEWEWASINNFYTNAYSRGTNTATVGVTTNYFHYKADLGPITNNPPASISAIFRCRITRPASGVRDYSNAHDVVMDSADVHVPVGNARMAGSRSDSAP